MREVLYIIHRELKSFKDFLRSIETMRLDES